MHLIVSAVLLQAADAAEDGQPRRPFTVGDLLRTEQIGAVQFTPDGGYIVMEYLPPYEERGQYGVDRGGRILKLELSGNGTAVPLFEHLPGKKYWLGERSPDRRRVLVFQAGRRELRIGVFDFESGRLALIDELPQVDTRFELNEPLWTSDDAIVFVARAKSSLHYGVRDRLYAADRTSTLRENAFSGARSSRSVSTDPPDRWHDGDLLRYDVNAGSVSVLARGRFGGFALSADGSQLATLRLGQRRLHFPVERLTDYYRFDTRLYVFDLENRSVRTFLPDKHVALGSLRWNPAGDRLSFFAWDVTTTMDDGSHVVLDVDSRGVIPVKIEGFVPGWIDLVPSGVLKAPVAAEWMHAGPVIYGMPEEGREPRWYFVDVDSMRAEAVIDAGGQSRRIYPAPGGRLLLRSDRGLHVVSSVDDAVAVDLGKRSAVRVLGGGEATEGTVVFESESGTGHALAFFDLDRQVLLTSIDGISGDIAAWDVKSRRLVVREDSANGGTLHLKSANGGSSAIFKFNRHLSEIEQPRWITIDYPGADGARTFSCVLLPYGYDPGVEYATIVDVYPGTGHGCATASGNRAQALDRQFLGIDRKVLAGHGYLVVRPGNTYALNAADGTLYGGLDSQVAAAIDALIAVGMTDPDRIALWGFSNGSMAGLWLASVSDRYRAVVSMFGASSPYLEYFSGTSVPTFELYLGTPIGHLVQYESRSGAMPLSMGRSAVGNPVAYMAASPLDRARHICSPVLMIQSDLDSFSTFQYEALFSALYRLGRHADLVRYYGEGHGLRSPGNIRDFYHRVFAFLDRNLAVGAVAPECAIADEL